MRRAEVVSPGFKNKKQVLASQEVGCFYCQERFTPKNIKEWTDDGETPICPHCMVDSVVARNPNDSEFEFTSWLKKLYKEKFSGREQ